ncbi:MAG: lysophospholipid acyltransferase family protein [Bdellovibrionales bacterium]
MKALIGWLGRALAFVIARSPRFVRAGLAAFLAFLWYDLFRIRRQVVEGNLALAFPDMSPKERVRLGRKNLRHIAMNLIEYSYLPFLNKKNVYRRFRFHNEELLQQALARGKGVLLMTLHLGNGDLACAALALAGYPMTMVSKFFKLQWLNDLWFKMRERLGVKFVPPRDSSFVLLRSLRQGRAVIIPLDQFTGPPIGVRTQFFGHETGTAAGLALMAERSGAPVLSVYTVREKDGTHGVYFMREMPVRTSPEDTPEQITQRFNDELESFVKLHPDQWMWIHKRWKKFKY